MATGLTPENVTYGLTQ